MGNIENIVTEYRNRIIEGKVIDLVPVSEEELPEIVRMRNQPKSMYFFNQEKELTVEEQKMWFLKYLKRTDDIYWVLKTKDGKVIGTQRLYDITDEVCEQGSTVVDEKMAMGAPYVAEAILLSTNFAFDVLGVRRVINDNRFDNKNMNSISKKVGFTLLREQEIRGVKYLYHELVKENFKGEKLSSLIDSWIELNS